MPVLAALLACTLVQQKADPTYVLKTAVKSGQEFNWRFEATALIDEHRLVIKGLRSEKVKTIAADGAWSVDLKQYAENAELDGKPIRMVSPEPAVLKFDKDGRPLSSGGDQSLERRARVLASVFPVQALKVGQFWKAEIAGAPGHPPVSLVYLLTSADDKAIRIDFQSTERELDPPMGAKGAFILDPKTKQIKQIQAVISNGPLTDKIMNYSMTMTLMQPAG